jgi:hypothetical protein
VNFNSDERLQEIKNRVLNTTEGNWQVLYCGGSNDQCYRIATEKNVYNPICELKNRHDAEFIGKSKDDIITLLNEIELLKNKIDNIKQQF